MAAVATLPAVFGNVRLRWYVPLRALSCTIPARIRSHAHTSMSSRHKAAALATPCIFGSGAVVPDTGIGKAAEPIRPPGAPVAAPVVDEDAVRPPGLLPLIALLPSV